MKHKTIETHTVSHEYSITFKELAEKLGLKGEVVRVDRPYDYRPSITIKTREDLR